MKRSPRLVLFALALALLAPSSANAHVGWWEWLDKLSGPGPFTGGPIFDFRLFCEVRPDTDPNTKPPGPTDPTKLNSFGEEASWTSGFRGPCLTNGVSRFTNRNLIANYVEVRYGLNKTETQPLFSDAPNELNGRVVAHQAMAVFMRQLDPSVAVGAGAGYMWFTGEPLDKTPSRVVITPLSAAVSPFKLWKGHPKLGRFVTLRIEALMILGELKATDFNSTSTSTYKTRGDFVMSTGITFDLGAFWN